MMSFHCKLIYIHEFYFVNQSYSTLSDPVSHSRTSPLRSWSSLKLNSTGSLQISSKIFLKVPREPHRVESDVSFVSN